MTEHFASFAEEHKQHVKQKLKNHNLSLSFGFIGLALIVLGCFLSAMGYIAIGSVFILSGFVCFMIGLFMTKFICDKIIYDKKSVAKNNREKKVIKKFSLE